MGPYGTQIPGGVPIIQGALRIEDQEGIIWERNDVLGNDAWGKIDPSVEVSHKL